MSGYAREMTASPPVSRFAGAALFAGRERELAALGHSAAEARRGEPRVAVIEGPPGMGKSALLTEFARRLPDAFVIRAGGAEPEMRLPYGLISQLTASACRPGSPRVMSDPSSRAPADPLAVGADLAAELSQVAPPGRLAVMVIDDIHWADPGSAAALLHALRRMHSGAFLTVLAARPVEFGQLAAGSWSRFAAGDYRAHRLRLEGFSVAEAQSLAQLITAAELPEPAAARLVHCTGGRPGYCRAVLDEAQSVNSTTPLMGGPGPAAVHEETIPVPRDVAIDVQARAGLLTAAASQLLDAAAVLGRSSSLAMAALLAGIPDPAGAVAEIATTGLATESLRRSGSQLQFADPLTHRAVHAQMASSLRRELHQRAASLTRQDERLRHRFAAAAGHDHVLAADLEAAGRSAARRAGAVRYIKNSATTRHEPTGEAATGQPASAVAADWLMQASALTPDAAASDRLVLDALEVLVAAGDARRAGALASRASEASPAPRRDALLGWLDLLTGRFAQAGDLLRDAWQAHDRTAAPFTIAGAQTAAAQATGAQTAATQATAAAQTAAAQTVGAQTVGAQAAGGLLWCSLHAGRTGDAVLLGERAVLAAGADAVLRSRAVNDLALALAFDRRGPGALASFGTLAACAADVPLSQTGALAARGMVRVIAGDLDAAVADLTAVAGRLPSGTCVPHAGLSLSLLAEAEFRLGAWDDAACHAELAVALTREAGRDGDLSLVHATASLVPAGRGDWAAAAAHVDAAGAAARTSGTALGIIAWATARAGLAMARADHAQVLRATKTVRDTGPAAAAFGRLPLYPWPLLEAEALIAQGNLDEADAALAAIDADLPAPAAAPAAATASPGTATVSSSAIASRVAAGRLRGLLAAARGDSDASAQAFETARHQACAAALPAQLAQLELVTGQALRQSARRPEAIAYLRAARSRLTQVGAVPAISACDQELAACGVQIGPDPSPATLGLTATELAVARLVAVGHSNRQAAAELYISIKGVEFHLRNIYAKLDIKSRRELAERLSDGAETLSQITAAELTIPLSRRLVQTSAGRY
jgi:DNA-binding CsgD family transcriptional regulator